MTRQHINTSIFCNAYALAALVAALAFTTASFAQPATGIRFENPCIAGRDCDWEEVSINTPVAEDMSSQAATKGLGDCRERTDASCRTQTVVRTSVTRAYVRKSERTALQAGKVTRIASVTNGTQVTTTQQVVSLPGLGVTLDANRYDNFRFGWHHTNGIPVSADHKFRTGDMVNLFFTSNRAGHIYIVNVDSAGTQTLLYPDLRRSSEKSFVSANTRVMIGTQFVNLPGIERIYAVFGPNPVPNFNALAGQIHRNFDGRPVDQMRLQAGTFNQTGDVSSNGIAVSQNMQAASKGMIAISSRVETSNTNPSLETSAFLNIDPLITVAHPYSVLAIDLIHISR